MDEHTAFDIGREWLRRIGASEERLPVVADAFQRIAAQPEAHAWATDQRLALLATKALWIATLSFKAEDDVTRVKIERVDLGDPRIRPSLTETHDVHWDRPNVITYTWRFDLDRINALTFESSEDYVHGQESDDPTLAFGWHLAEETGWTRPS